MHRFHVDQSETDVTDVECNPFAEIPRPQMIQFYIWGPLCELALVVAAMSFVVIAALKALIGW